MFYFFIILLCLSSLNLNASKNEIRSKVRSLSDSSEFYLNIKDYDKSLLFAEKAFKTINETNYVQDRLYEQIIVLLAKNHSYKKNFDLSYKYFKEHCDITANIYGDTSLNYVKSLINFSIINKSLNRFDTVKYILNKSISILEKHLPHEKETLAIALGRMGNMYQEDFQFDKAHPYLIKSLELLNEVYPDGSSHTAIQLMSLGYNYHQRFDLVRSEKYKKQAVQMFEAIDADADERFANAILNLAYVYIDQGRLELAKETMERSVKMYKNLGDSHSHKIAFAEMSLGLIYFHLGNYDTAKDLYMNSLSTYKKDFHYEHHNMTRLYDNIGDLFEKTGDLDSAIFYYEKSAELSKKVYDNGGSRLPIIYLNLVDIYYKKRDIEKVEFYASLADKNFRKILPENHLYMLYVHYAFAQLHLLKENIDSVRFYYSNAFSILKNHFRTNSINLSENEHYQFLTTIKTHFDSFNTLAIKYYEKNPKLINDMFENQLFYKGVLLSSQRNIRNIINQTDDSSSHQLYKNWLENKNLYAKLYNEYSNNERKEYRLRLDSLSIIINDIEKDMQLTVDRKNIETKNIKEIDIDIHEPDFAESPPVGRVNLDLSMREYLEYLVELINSGSAEKIEIIAFLSEKEKKSLTIKKVKAIISFLRSKGIKDNSIIITEDHDSNLEKSKVEINIVNQ